MKSDRDIQVDVHDALDREPGVDASQIGVTVQHGVVTLRGTVPTYLQKMTAAHASCGVGGVHYVANDLDVKPAESLARTDAAIAAAVSDTLDRDLAVPVGAVTATVQNGWVTLEGSVSWRFQRMAAEDALRHLAGIRGIVNAIRIRPYVRVSAIKAGIEDAFKRCAEIDAANVNVEVRNGVVTLRGRVHSFIEREEAENAVLALPGVVKLEDRLLVSI
jgi:osmotically-inducible protein OsmY